MYAADHGGIYPSVANFKDQLKRYTDAAGNVSKRRTPVFLYGPYLTSIPAVPAGPSKGSSKVASAPGIGVGWIYNETSGDIRVNAVDEKDAGGIRYADY